MSEAPPDFLQGTIRRLVQLMGSHAPMEASAQLASAFTLAPDETTWAAVCNYLIGGRYTLADWVAMCHEPQRRVEPPDRRTLLAAFEYATDVR